MGCVGWNPCKRGPSWRHVSREGNVQGSVGGRKRPLGPHCTDGGSWFLGLGPRLCACQEAGAGGLMGHTPAREPPGSTRQACVLNLASTSNSLSSLPLSDPLTAGCPSFWGATHGSDGMNTIQLFLQSPLKARPKRVCVFTIYQLCPTQPPSCARRGNGLEAGLPL